MIMFTSTGGIAFVVTNENKLLPPCTDLSLSHITAFVVNAEGLLWNVELNRSHEHDEYYVLFGLRHEHDLVMTPIIH